MSVSPERGSRRRARRRRALGRAFLGTCALAACAALAGERVWIELPLPPPTAAQRISPPVSMTAVGLPRVAPQGRPSRAPQTATEQRPPSAEVTVTRYALAKGESLYVLFARNGLSQADLARMVNGDRELRRRLSRLRPGQMVQVHAAPGGRVQRLVLETPGPTDLYIERESDRYRVRTAPDDGPTTAQAVAADAAQETSPAPVANAADAPETRSPAGADDPAAALPEVHRSVTVRRGDSLYSIFRRLGIPATDLANLLAAGPEAKSLERLRPGQDLTLQLDHVQRLHTLVVDLDETRTLHAVRDEPSFAVRVETHALERRTSTASAVIESSLFLAGQRTGLSDGVIMDLVEIFGWDVDFALEVRAGDRFTVVYEELYKNGDKVRDGHILASEFFNRGRSIRAIRYVDDTGYAAYFSPEGLSMRKAFLRTPVNFTRISSRFQLGRKHPILHRIRAHRGVDYAAPTGTPIKAAGNGRVVFSGWKNGFGKTVILQHGSTYTTLFGHMSRVHRRARSGKRVRQGEIIGYVGKTGLASGPHLHYEFRVRGRHKDPLKVKLPKALPIARKYRADFLRKSQSLIARLDVLARTEVATSD